MFFRYIKIITPLILIIISLSGPGLAFSQTKIASGDKARLRGWAMSAPGQFASQYFYFFCQGEIFQIYNYWKKFPPISYGDYLEVNAIFSSSANFRRFKTKEAEDIRIIKKSSDTKLPTPKIITSHQELSESSDPAFIEISGQVIKTNSKTLSLSLQGEEVIIDGKIVGPQEIEKISTDMEINVSGLLIKTSKQNKLYPLNSSNLKILSQAIKNINSLSQLENRQQTLNKNEVPINKTLNKAKYLGVFLTCLLIFIIMRKR